MNTLAFALRIQAAGVSRRLKQDMADQDPTIDSREPQGTQLSSSRKSRTRRFDAFEHYVTAKWPLRVYAIEPVIAQQNVADAYRAE